MSADESRGWMPQTGVSFARALAGHGDRLAVVTTGGDRLTYRQLAERVAEVAERLGPVRRLVLVAAANELDPLVTYLAALAAGHPVVLTGPDEEHRTAAHTDGLIATYDPDVELRRVDGEWRLRERRSGSAHRLHPDLALLLSTSGSTGSSKLVRLSAENLRSNAEAIASYLDIRDTDRAVANLPMHYCYGLSIINSNLLRGAALLLTDDSVVSPRFWEMVRAHRGTSLHGVPYTFDLFDRVGFDRMHLPDLRYVTQAGGALPPQRVREVAGLAERGGWRFHVMYGQTEATARMAHLPPELAASRPNAIGVPIPGGSFEILGSEVPGQGELVYRGPNVMLGYAEHPADLARGRTLDALPTGDVARRATDGLYEVVGRASRFTKLFGLRVDLARTERILAEHGCVAACAGSDEALVAATTAHPDRVVDILRAQLALPVDRLRVVSVGELPRLPSGKIDYPEIRRMAESADAAVPATPVRQRFATVLGLPDAAAILPDASFVDLGGDSLSYVRMSLEIERALGYMPSDWPAMPVDELERIAAAASGSPSDAVPGPGSDSASDRASGVASGGPPTNGPWAAFRRGAAGWTAPVETNVVLRAVAITLIVSNHINLFHHLGGAHLLLVIAGWSFARFYLVPPRSGTRKPDISSRISSRILRSTARIAVPSVLLLAWRAAVTEDVRFTNVLLIDNYLREGVPGYWFVEVLVQTLLVLAALFAVPAVRRLERRHGFAFASVVFAASFAAHLPADDNIMTPFPDHFYVTHGTVWFFALGWLAYRATTISRRMLVVGIGAAAVLGTGYFGNTTRETVVTVGLALMVFVPRVRLPRFAVPPLGLLASASLYVYLTHYTVYDAALPHLHPAVVLALCFATGVLTWWAAQQVTRAAHLLNVRSRGWRSSRTPKRVLHLRNVSNVMVEAFLTGAVGSGPTARLIATASGSTATGSVPSVRTW